MTENVASKVSRGAGWMIASRLIDSGLGMISTITLARLLVPEDFGLVALATTLAATLQLIRAFSFDVVLIQRQNAGRDEYDTAFTLNLLFSLLISMLLVGGAWPMADFYDDPRLVAIVQLIALTKLLEGCENVGIVDFRKNLDFFREFMFVLLKRIGSFVVTILLAVTLRSYWALVLGLAFGQTIGVVLSYALHPHRPRLSLSAWRDLIGFSKWNAINAIAHAVSIRAGAFLVGKSAGPSSLGAFVLAEELAFLPSSELGAPINRAVYPGYALAAQDPERLRAALYRVVSVMGIVILPVGVGLAVTADSVVPLVLGDKWTVAIPLVPILALRGLIHALTSNVPYVYMALGRPHLGTLALVARATILLPLLGFLLGESGLIGAAWAYTASMALEVPIHYAMLRSILAVRVRSLLASLLRPTLSVAAMAFVVRGLSAAWPMPEPTMPALIRVGGLVAVGALTYAVTLFGLWVASGRPEGGEQMGLEMIQARLGRGRAI